MSFADTYLTRKQVCETLGISTSTLRRLVDCGEFPQPIQISERRQLFQQKDLVGWLNHRKQIGALANLEHRVEISSA
ncbi:MAG: AlpA family phage regulatory protein, partial [Pseudomonadota bacterium]|nr:AlpA family phage regulatory protein [Pseudomonadota bacterium]